MVDFKKYEEEFRNGIRPVMEWMHYEFNKIKVGLANPMILDDILVEAYDGKVKINTIANISIPEPRSLVIKPYDKSLLKNIALAINIANIGINPQVDADVVRLVFPMPTEDSRKECLKKVKIIGEEAKVGIRKTRQKLQDEFKKDPEVLEDDKKYFHEKLDELTKEANKEIDNAILVRDKEIMTI